MSRCLLANTYSPKNTPSFSPKSMHSFPAIQTPRREPRGWETVTFVIIIIIKVKQKQKRKKRTFEEKILFFLSRKSELNEKENGRCWWCRSWRPMWGQAISNICKSSKTRTRLLLDGGSLQSHALLSKAFFTASHHLRNPCKSLLLSLHGSRFTQSE